MTTRSISGRLHVGLASVLGCYAVAYTAWIAIRPLGQDDLRFIAVTDVGLSIPPLAAGVIGFMAARISSGRPRRGWLLFALGWLSWGLAQSVWTFYEVVLRVETPFPSLADIGYLAAVPLMLGGVVMLMPREAGRQRYLDLVSIAALALVVAALIWNFVLADILTQSDASPLQKVLLAAYPLGDFLLLAVVSLALQKVWRGVPGVILAVLSMGLLSFLTADLAFAYLNLSGEYTSGNLIANPSWAVGFLLMAYGAGLQAIYTPSYREVLAESSRAPWLRAVPPLLLILVVGLIAGDALGAAPFQYEDAWVLAAVVTGAVIAGRVLLTLADGVRFVVHARRELFRAAESQSTLRTVTSVLEHLTDGVIIVNRDGRVIRANPAAERLFGRTTEEIISSGLSSLMPEEYRQQHLAGMAVYLATGKARTFGRWLRLQGLKPDGSKFPLDLRLNQAEWQADADAPIIGVIRDATESEALDRMRRDMIATVSHEFRTPLAAISLFLDLAKTVPTESPGLERHLDVINRNVGRLNRLVEDLLLLADPLSESSTAEEQIDLMSIVLAAIRTAQPAAEAASLSLSWELVPGPALHGDAIRLGQVFDNLLSNAVKYTDRGGFIRVVGQADDTNWVVSITNSDTSLRHQEVQELFEPFQRGAKPKSASIPGTGLGLAIAKKIVERQNGSIALTVHPDHGTTVTVRLPLALRASVDAGPPERETV